MGDARARSCVKSWAARHRRGRLISKVFNALPCNHTRPPVNGLDKHITRCIPLP